MKYLLLLMILAAGVLTIACASDAKTDAADKNPSSVENTTDAKNDDDGVTDGDKADARPADNSGAGTDDESKQRMEKDADPGKGSEKAANKTQKTLEKGANTGPGVIKKGVDEAVNKKP